jgi:DNA-binding transcriptional MerR regulator
MAKSSQAFRTIREVAEWLDVAAHVLRFWESKFPQIKPVKRAGGRRYYRPADMELVGGIKVLLHDRGLTIRGVQKMLREEGAAAVAALSPPIDMAGSGEADEAADWIEDAAEEAALAPPPRTRQTAFDFAAVEDAEELADDDDDDGEDAADAHHDALAHLGWLAAAPARLPPAARARLVPALAALCDRMRADPRP